MKKSLFTAFSAAVLALAGANYAKADVVTTLVSHVGTVYTYDVALKNPESFVPGPGSSMEFGTLYNVYGTLGATTGLLSTAFAFTTGNFVGSPASGEPSVPLTSALNTDIRYTFTGSSTISSAMGDVDLGHFIVNANPLSSSVVSTFDGSATDALGITGNHGNVSTPTAAPEPVSLSLLGGGLAFIGLARLRRNRK